jgi:hypothetical protein
VRSNHGNAVERGLETRPPANIAKLPELLSIAGFCRLRTVMSQLLLQVVIVVALGAFCFGCGYLTAFIVTRNQWRDEMIKRGVARYNWQTGKWQWGEPLKESNIECPSADNRRPSPRITRGGGLCAGLNNWLAIRPNGVTVAERRFCCLETACEWRVLN